MRGSRPANSAVFLLKVTGVGGAVLSPVNMYCTLRLFCRVRRKKGENRREGQGRKITFSKLWCANGGTCIGLESFGGSGFVALTSHREGWTNQEGDGLSGVEAGWEESGSLVVDCGAEGLRVRERQMQGDSS